MKNGRFFLFLSGYAKHSIAEASFLNPLKSIIMAVHFIIDI
jgi:hypothetical protein